MKDAKNGIDAGIEAILTRESLRSVVSDIVQFYSCKCGEDPFEDGEPCPVCFGVQMCEVLGIELHKRTEPSVDELE
jgi:hypothetical protein